MANPIGNLGTIPTLTIAGRVFTDLTTLIKLKARVSGATNRYSGFRKNAATSAYTPSGATAFLSEAASYTVFDAVATSQMVVGSSDNDCGFAGTTAPTNPVYESGAAASGPISINLEGVFETPLFMAIPNAKFGFADNLGQAAGVALYVFGYET